MRLDMTFDLLGFKVYHLILQVKADLALSNHSLAIGSDYPGVNSRQHFQGLHIENY